MPRNRKEIPADVKFVRKLLGLGRGRNSSEKSASREDNSSGEKGSERISAMARAEISGQLGQEANFRLAVSVQFQAKRLAETLGISTEDPAIKELAAEATKPVEICEPAYTQGIEGQDLFSNPQIKMGNPLKRPQSE